ncbi:MAG: methyltransferase domain-containing protein [Nanoarchaeota archaeon]
MNLNIGGGLIKKEGFVNVDILKGADIVHDLNKTPYPFKDNSIDLIFCSHTLEHLKEPELFFNEVQRILKKGAKCVIIVPHYKHPGAYSNFGHRGFYEPNAIDNVCVEHGHIVKKPFRLIETKIIRRKKLFWKPKEIKWVIEKI